ncbi:MAG: transposase (plasmid) [Leptolyngbya sp. BL-A-14]
MQALQATHARTRERLLALYAVCQGKSATAVGRQSGRNPQTIMAWVHRYNEAGFESLLYQSTGGHPPLCLLPSSKG